MFVKFFFLILFASAAADFVKYDFEDTILQNAQNNEKVSDICQKYIDVFRYKRRRLEGWALKMQDAWSKIPSGILSGNFINLGSFDQCVGIDERFEHQGEPYHVMGKYFAGFLSVGFEVNYENFMKNYFKDMKFPRSFTEPPIQPTTFYGLQFLMAFCLPSVCSSGEVTELASGPNVQFYAFELFSQTKEKRPLTQGDIIVLIIFGIVGGLLVLSTLYDAILFFMKKKPAHELLIAFSAYSNGRKLFTLSKSPSQISCVSGIRVMSMLYIILAHRYGMYLQFLNSNLLDIYNAISLDASMFLHGSSYAVDTFIFLSGLVICYVFLVATSKGVKFNIVLYYIHRYIRLTPALVAVMAVHLTILKHLGSGPLWPAIYYGGYVCEQTWWRLLLYIQNYYRLAGFCVMQSWYLSLDMQLFILSPILLLPLTKYPKSTLAFTSVLILAVIAGSSVVAAVKQLNGIFGGLSNSGDYFVYYYHTTHLRCGPWLIGFITGYLIFKIKNSKRKFTLPKFLVFILWLLSLGLFAAIIFGGNEMLVGEYDSVINTVYIALSRQSWALALAWVVLACDSGYGGPIDWFLSSPMFEILSKLTYSVYLVHATIINLQFYQDRQAQYFNHLSAFYLICGDFMFSLGLGLIWSLLFESPILVLEKYVFSPQKGLFGKLFLVCNFNSTARKTEKTEDPEKVIASKKSVDISAKEPDSSSDEEQQEETVQKENEPETNAEAQEETIQHEKKSL